MAGQPNQILVNYIWNYLHQGYSLTSIRTQLTQNGYAEKDINLAIDYVYANYYYGKTAPQNDPRQTYAQQQPKHPGISLPSIHSIVPIVLIIIGAALFGFAFIFIMFTDSTQTVEVPVQQDFEEDVIQSEQDPATEDPVSNPSLDEQDDVIQEPENSSPNQPDTPDLSTPSDPEVNEPFSGEMQYTPRQIDLKVAYFGTRNPKEAMKFCDIIQRDVERFFCYRDVAQYSGNYLYCQSIPEQNYEDDCYLNLVLEDPSQDDVCSSIENEFKRDNCLRVAEYANIEFNQSDISSINESSELDPADYASPADFY